MFGRGFLYFLGGVVVGAVATKVVTKGDIDFKEIGSNLLAKGINLSEEMISQANIAKENLDDFVAEARQTASTSTATTKKTSTKKA